MTAGGSPGEGTTGPTLRRARIRCSRPRRVASAARPAQILRVSRLDEFAPVWQFNEVHTITVQALPDRVYRAIRAVSAAEVRFFRALTWLRRLGRPGPPSLLNPPAHLPLLEVATKSGFLLLADEPNRELVVGTVVIRPSGAPRPTSPTAFRALDAPGYAKATLAFQIDPAAPARSLVRTETRVYAADPATRRRFATYWGVIYPGSALLRRMWLRAIRRRAEDGDHL